MSLTKRNIILAVCFAFALSVVLSLCVVICFGSHAHICEDENCRVCMAYHTAEHFVCSFKVIALSVIAICVCAVTAFSEIPLPSPSELTPVSNKNKQTS